ncbi:MAG TPA: biotin-dependent carboxyltransferase family protein [Planctomycetota bacterium]|nr:biotin-dependent carboxyltransferase family protein [Planctomycetota bacterium]
MTLEVVRAGPFATVQDLGRFGHLRHGVPPSGAMDPFALEVANLLVGNPRGAAALEVAPGRLALRCLAEGLFAVTGADLDATVDGKPAPRWEAFAVHGGETLSFGRALGGVFAYLALAGGIDVDEVMGSRSTYVRARLGGFEGRPLGRGDLLRAGPIAAPLRPAGRRLPREVIPSYSRRVEARVILGPDLDRFTEQALATLLASPFEVTPRSDRMGYRLRGPSLRHRGGADILTDALATGSVQVPPDGQPIVLLADRPATGGYARIATVITADVGKVAQSPPGGTVSFRSVEIEQAQAEALRFEARLADVEKRLPRGD